MEKLHGSGQSHVFRLRLPQSAPESAFSGVLKLEPRAKRPFGRAQEQAVSEPLVEPCQTGPKWLELLGRGGEKFLKPQPQPTDASPL